MSIISNRRVFLEDWIPPKIIDREEQISKFEEYIFNSLIKRERTPLCLYVYGGTGSGKTFVTKKLIENHQEEIKRHLPKFDFLYINTGRVGIPTTHTIVTKINAYLEKYLPIETEKRTITRIPLRGWRTNEHLDIMRKIIKRENICLLLVLDEIDSVIEREKSDDIMYTFLDSYQDFDEDWIGISTIFISNDPTLLQKLRPKTEGRIPGMAHFTSYGTKELYQILKIHAKQGLKRNTYQEEDLSDVASIVADQTASARDAKQLLFNLAKISEDKLDLSKLELARTESEKDILKKEIASRSFHQKLVLLAVLKKHQISKHYSKSKMRGLRKWIAQPTSGSIYKIYKKLSKEYATKPKHHRTFYRMIKSLARDNLVKTNVTSLGKARGVTTLIYPESPNLIKPILSRAIKEDIE